MDGAKIYLVVMLACCLLNNNAPAAESAADGKEKSMMCQLCHGSDGISQEPLVPKLAGQHAEYIIKQILEFQIANRFNERMTPMSHAFDELGDLKDIAAYFSSQKPMQGVTFSSVALPLGKHIYENGIATRGVFACRGCHGSHAEMKRNENAMFPVIAGQHKSYLVKQLLDFREQCRRTDASGSMHNITKALTKSEIQAVAEYVSSL